jgi:hypothetical protein
MASHPRRHISIHYHVVRTSNLMWAQSLWNTCTVQSSNKLKNNFTKESPSPQANSLLRYSFYGNPSSMGNCLHGSANRSYPKSDKSTPCLLTYFFKSHNSIIVHLRQLRSSRLVRWYLRERFPADPRKVYLLQRGILILNISAVSKSRLRPTRRFLHCTVH